MDTLVLSKYPFWYSELYPELSGLVNHNLRTAGKKTPLS